MGDLKEAGCVALSDDGQPVAKRGDSCAGPWSMRSPFGLTIISHAEDLSLVGEGVMNEGFVATELGLKGIPWVAEDAAVARDVMLAEYTGARLHVAHVSTRGAVEIIRAAQERGVRVTCEATPHHFTLTEDAVRGYDTNAKMNPPLRSAEDVAAVRGAGRRHHRRHRHRPRAPSFRREERRVQHRPQRHRRAGNGSAPDPAPGQRRGSALHRGVARLTTGPAAVLGIPRGTLEIGVPADVTIIDPEQKWTVEAGKLLSKSKNTPFDGWKMKGAATHTILGGKLVWIARG